MINLFVEYVMRQAKQLVISCVNAQNYSRGNTKEGITMLLERSTGNCVRNSILKSLKNGIYTIFKRLVKMSTTN